MSEASRMKWRLLSDDERGSPNNIMSHAISTLVYCYFVTRYRYARVTGGSVPSGLRVTPSSRDKGFVRRATFPEDVTVVEHGAIPTSLLADLYRRGHPSSVHAVRDEAFLKWRYRNPDWEYRAFSATANGRIDAAVVTGTQTDADGVTTTNIVDVLPLASSDRRDAALGALLANVTAEFSDSDLLAYCGTAIPRSLLADHGFHFDGSFPLDRVTSPTKLVAYDTGDGDPPWSPGGVDISTPRGWGLSYVELDAR